MLNPTQPLAIYMEGEVQARYGKMGFGVLRYSPNPIACVVDSVTAGGSVRALTGIPRDCPIVATIDEAIALGAEVLVLGIAPSGGAIPASWYPVIDTAVSGGMSIVNGLHDRLGPHYNNLKEGQWIWDIRVEPTGLKTGTGAALTLSNKRVLMIGTDMAVGKMTAGLELQKAFQESGRTAGFVATGQIGVSITGAGVPLDAVRVDFACGVIEREVMSRSDSEVVIIEGQGSLIHPGSTANLPLLRGSMPTHFVLCHRAGQKTLEQFAHFPIPPLREFVEMYQDLAEARGTFSRPVLAGVALNTGQLATDAAALDACQEVEMELGVPCVDALRHGMGRIANAIA